MGWDDVQAHQLHALAGTSWSESNESVECLGNQHTCMPRMYVHGLGEEFDLVLRGTGSSTIVGHARGPRALVWKETELRGHHPRLGDLRVSLEPTEVHAGTLVPLTEAAPLPAINRNAYYFRLSVNGVGDMRSERPAIVEALIDAIPPTATYEFKNAPLDFYLVDDPEHRPVVTLLQATTDVHP